MYNIYFDKRILKICEISNHAVQDPNTIIFNAGSLSNIGKLPDIIDKCHRIRNMVVPTPADKIETTFKQICSEYRQINAGGGLVENEKGEYLLIFRNGVWDLPKGKQEPNEDIRSAALREVEEECGINELVMNELICITRHCYHQDNKFILKHTYWYKMVYTNGHTPKPQREENIQETKWVKKAELKKYLANTYPSIQEVFIKSGIVAE